MDEDSLEIYVDSSTSENAGKGSVGIRVLAIDLNGNEVVYDFQLAGYISVNSGQMEIIACARALEEIMHRQLTLGKKQVTIFTDSKYVADNYRNAMFHWVGSQWLSKDGRPVLDAPEWKHLVKQIQKYSKSRIFIDIKWVKGHGTNQHNAAVHKLAKDILRLPSDAYSKNSMISVFRPDQIKAPKKLEIGSVKMEGQKISIRIISIEYLRLQKVWCCKYQVTSKTSAYHGCVDKIFSSVSVDVGKYYYVKFNKNPRNPRLERIYWEIKVL